MLETERLVLRPLSAEEVVSQATVKDPHRFRGYKHRSLICLVSESSEGCVAPAQHL
jgi:hypothetical protein